jgi:predicted nucleotide-binding protein
MRRIRIVLFSIFGKDAAIVKDLDMLVKEAQSKGLSRDHFAQRLADVESVVDYLNRLGVYPLACPVSRTSRAPSTKDVFIIHGHDELNTRRLSQLLHTNFGLNPIAMLAKPGMSRPLTDKFEDEARTCSFAFALFTPDDEVVKPKESYNQARPNVIYEVGWFIGRLGRERVTLILKAGTKIHSDLDGVSQIRFGENVEDKFLEIQNELKAAKLIP